jgi:hypothetical protein
MDSSLLQRLQVLVMVFHVLTLARLAGQPGYLFTPPATFVVLSDPFSG